MSVAVAFAETVRSEGVSVATGNVAMFAEAVAAVGVTDPQLVYWAGRTTLTHGPDDVPRYDRAFAAFFAGMARQETAVVTIPTPVLVDDDGAPDPESGPATDGAVHVRYSRTEVLRHKDFAAYTHEEFAEARRLLADLRLAGALRRTRRRRPTHRMRGTIDVRRTVRRALRTGGVPVRPVFAAGSERPRRVVLLCDVSGSMDPYARSLLRFLHAGVAGGARVEAFALGTRLTRITRDLSARDPDAALAAAGRHVADWSGGTRLGAGLRAFNDEWGVRGLARGAVVVILSDGWDRGDTAELATEMGRLRRVAYRIVWVNPLKASPGYAPLARGMAAALPYVDDFVEGHSVDALARLAEVVARR